MCLLYTLQTELSTELYEAKNLVLLSALPNTWWFKSKYILAILYNLNISAFKQFHKKIDL